MKLKKVILARPNSFIIKSMRGLITDAGHEPTPLNDLEELSNVLSNEISGFVVSTGVASVVKESYSDVIKKIIMQYESSAIILATMIDVELTKSTVMRNFNGSLSRTLLSVSEAAETPDLKASKHIVILTKKDLTDDATYPNTLAVIKRLLK